MIVIEGSHPEITPGALVSFFNGSNPLVHPIHTLDVRAPRIGPVLYNVL